MAESTAKKKPAAKKVMPTVYQVQRVYDAEDRTAAGMEPSTLELWQDVAVIETTAGGEKACKLAAAQLGKGDKDPRPGRFRAFPARSDSRLDVQAQQQTVVTYSKPAVRASAQTNGGTST